MKRFETNIEYQQFTVVKLLKSGFKSNLLYQIEDIKQNWFYNFNCKSQDYGQ
jgi:hypothetical protein